MTELEHRFECGCHVWREGKIFYINPCRLNCPVVKEVLKQSLQKHIPFFLEQRRVVEAA